MRKTKGKKEEEFNRIHSLVKRAVGWKKYFIARFNTQLMNCTQMWIIGCLARSKSKTDTPKHKVKKKVTQLKQLRLRGEVIYSKLYGANQWQSADWDIV